jgi:5-(carboxyamino)imidazole ribonucleotide synthase
MARGILAALDVVGVLCVELFVTRDGRLLVNELAPRPHNSGHLTFDAAVTSQFEQQLRAICGLPLGSTELLRPAAMANLLGDLWEAGEPDWTAALAFPEVKLHLYGKATPRPGRKMGHLTALAPDRETALSRVTAARAALVGARANRPDLSLRSG